MLALIGSTPKGCHLIFALGGFCEVSAGFLRGLCRTAQVSARVSARFSVRVSARVSHFGSGGFCEGFCEVL